MIKKGKSVHVKGDSKVYTVMAAWKLDSFQKEDNPGAIYGYEIEARKGVVQVIVDTQIERIER